MRVFVLLAFAARLFASACPTAPTALSTYIGFGATGCTINGEIVDSFAFTVGSTSGGLSPLTAAAIMVVPTFTASNFQLAFSATGGTTSTGFTVSGSQFANYEIDFNWDPLVGGAEDDMVANSPTNPGSATVNTDLCVGALFSPTCSGSPATLHVFDDGNPPDNILKADTFFSPVLVIGTQSFINLSANGAQSTITGFDTSVFITPEPGGMGLAAAGLLGLAWRGFRRRRQPVV